MSTQLTNAKIQALNLKITDAWNKCDQLIAAGLNSTSHDEVVALKTKANEACCVLEEAFNCKQAVERLLVEVTDALAKDPNDVTAIMRKREGELRLQNATISIALMLFELDALMV